jgi:hypothetical protein
MAYWHKWIAKAIMNSIADILRYPAPPNMLPNTRNYVDKLLYITQRFNDNYYREFNATCMARCF